MRVFQDVPLFYSGARGSEEHRRLLAESVNIDNAELRLLSFFAQPETSGGTSSAYTVSLGVSANAPLESGRLYRMVPDQNNAQGAVTVNPNDTGAVSVKLLDDTDPWGGAMKQDEPSLLRYDGTDLILLNPHGPCIALLQQQEPSGDDGGSSVAATWNTRELNAEVYDTGDIVTLSSDQFTIQPGTYRAYCWAVGYRVGKHILKWRDITNTQDSIHGGNINSGTADNTSNMAIIDEQITISAATTYELQHYTQAVQASSGLGLNGGVGLTEKYASVWIQREVPI